MCDLLSLNWEQSLLNWIYIQQIIYDPPPDFFFVCLFFVCFCFLWLNCPVGWDVHSSFGNSLCLAFFGHWVALCAICCCSHSTPQCGSTEPITRSRSPGWHVIQTVADMNGFVQIIASNRISWTTKTTIVMIVYRNYQLHMQNTQPVKKKIFVCEFFTAIWTICAFLRHLNSILRDFTRPWQKNNTV